MDIPFVLRNTPALAGWAGRRHLELGVQGQDVGVQQPGTQTSRREFIVTERP